MDFLSELILDEYRQAKPVFEKMQAEVTRILQEALENNGLVVTAVVSRIKTEKSLAGKLALKGAKYTSLSDITDILGARIITYYTDDVDRIAAMAETLFEIDWANSVDKRKLHQLDSFGYNSLHYICRLPGYDYRFELQLRTTLQHAWASINHDTGYKSGIEIPHEYMRRINRLAGLLELADDEFSHIRIEINDYRRRVQQLVQNGQLDDVLLDGDTFRSFLEARPFEKLNKRIAAINQAEIQDVPLNEYLKVLKTLGCNTLGDVARLRNKYEEDAYALARHQLGNTNLDIISSAVGLQNICIVYILQQGGGKIGLLHFFNALNGDNSQNRELAELTFNQAANLPFMTK
ncbi:MAG: hypothetical protein IKO26_11880 [Paludibacteraceae bacterium]|nr:hypothetical protein [Paludibacteraceae bacterium]